MSVDHRLAVYGTLAPGEPNHHELNDLRGDWIPGTIKGKLAFRGWGADMGYPALTIGEDGEDIREQIFISADLPAHWQRLDEFEGEEYQRTRVTIATQDGALDAWIYLDAVVKT